MKTLSVIMFAIIFASVNCFADSSCLRFSDDPYEPDARLLKGPYKDECLDSTSRRAAAILKETESSLTVANFYYKGQWWIAEYFKNSVQDVLFHTAIFKTDFPFIVAAHTQIRFKLNPEKPLRLIPQRKSAAHEEITLNDLIISFEHMGPEGAEYDIVRGQFDYFSIVGRFVSTEARYQEQVIANNETVKQIPLKLTREQANTLFQMGLQRSQSLGVQVAYNTIEKNCVTELFDLFDEIFKYPQPVERFKTPVSRDPVEGPAIKALKERALIDESRKEPTLNDEFKAPSDP